MRKQKFIRRGAWCQCERSCNTSKGERENGLSVHDCEQTHNKKWRATGSSWNKRQMLVGDASNPKDIWFLVEGIPLNGQKGGDGEPLLASVSVVAELRSDGDSLFLEIGQITSINHSNHPGYPNCECQDALAAFGIKPSENTNDK
jgi:hypothetical protein